VCVWQRELASARSQLENALSQLDTERELHDQQFAHMRQRLQHQVDTLSEQLASESTRHSDAHTLLKARYEQDHLVLEMQSQLLRDKHEDRMRDTEALHARDVAAYNDELAHLRREV
jgi:hypothetical protein